MGTKFFANHFFLTCIEFADSPFKFSFCINFHPCKTFCLVCFCNSFKRFNILAAIFVSNIFYNKCFKSRTFMTLNLTTRICSSCFKRIKICQIRHKCGILHFHIKTQVWFVASIKVKSIFPCNAVKMSWQIVIQSFFENVLHHSFCCRKNFFSVCKTHFHINLSKFRLTISAGIFIAITSCNLEIFVKTRNHQKLFVKLWRLWKRIKFSRMNTAWNKVVSRSFWR